MLPMLRSAHPTVHLATRVRSSSPIRARAVMAASKAARAALQSFRSTCAIPRLLSREASQSRARVSWHSRARASALWVAGT